MGLYNGPHQDKEENKVGTNYEELCKELSELAKRFNISFVIGNKPTFRPKRYMIRFTMKRRWGGVKKYAYECTVDNLKAYVDQIEKAGGKIIGID
uniref:Uncharacterized protein n=1 Tax=Salmonella phage vB_SEnST11_KE22 TaxID=3161173 RepID=A0AAU8GHU5_9CAUD